MEVSFKAEIGGKPLSISAGKLAKQASGAVTVQYGETVILVTVVAANKPSPGIDFLPLSVEYQEKIYSAGRIPGNYHRREIGRPSEKETLTSRLIDRPIRPLFPKGFNFETQIIATVLSMDKENDPDVLAMLGASAALEISDIPFEGPIAGVRVVRVNGELKINPTLEECDESDINIIVAGSKTGIVMVEGEGDIVSEAEMLEAIFFGHKAMQPLINIQAKLRKSIGNQKRDFVPEEKDGKLIKYIESVAEERIYEAITIPEKKARQSKIREVVTDIIENLDEAFEGQEGEAKNILYDIQTQISRDLILKEGRRIDNREFNEVRPIDCEVGILPRPHGSALFTRGETQVLGVLTLGSGQDEQRIETLSGEEYKPFMLHYNFPPYSVGEVKRIGGPSRRDIGHGILAQRAIEKILPPKDEFEYTIRLVSEVFESNGSSSMGTVCSGCLALMDGGVPIKTPVSGIAMGLIKEDDQVVILSDILGDEDHTGDMDFKVTGTKDGITALQMDIKIKELSKPIMKKALSQAKDGRLHILDKMLEALDASRSKLSPYAPTVYSIKINPDRIRDIIGPGGKTIRTIQAETNTRIEVDDSGLVKISSDNKKNSDAALKIVEDIGLDPEIGDIFEGQVVKTTDFGAFVQIKPGTEGLVHISQLATYHVKRVEDIVREGDFIKVKVLEITRDGKIRLSHKALLEEDRNGKYRK